MFFVFTYLQYWADSSRCKKRLVSKFDNAEIVKQPNEAVRFIGQALDFCSIVNCVKLNLAIPVRIRSFLFPEDAVQIKVKFLFFRS